MRRIIFPVSKETFKTIENIANGLFNPLRGFLAKEDFESVLKKGRLKNNTPWTIPIVFDVNPGQVKPGQKIILTYGRGSALFSVKEIFAYSKNRYAKNIFGTLDEKHPGVRKIKRMKDFLAGGEITLLKRSSESLSDFIITPAQAKAMFKKRGWKTIAAFQTRNAPHLGHEFLQKMALNLCDGLFINPVIGKKAPGDLKDHLIKKTYEVLIKRYFPEQNVVLGAFNYEMNYAGPKEAVHHAIIRKNFGCTHFIVGRDHAGIGNYYPPFAAQQIFKKYPDLGITPIFFSSFFYCKKCYSIVTEKTCPHPEHRMAFQGRNLREILAQKKTPPRILMRPEVFQIIKRHPNPFV